MGLAEVVLMVVGAAATLAPLALGILRYLCDRHEAGPSATYLPYTPEHMHHPTHHEVGPHLALEIITPAQPGADEISAASKAAQRRIDRMDADDWNRRYTALLPTIEPPQPGNGCTCEWEDAGTLSQPGQLIHTRYDADCPNHQPPERLP